MSSPFRPGAPGAVDSVLTINWRALAVLLGLGVGVGAVLLALALTRQGESHGTVAREVQRLVEAGRDDLALRNINQYLVDHPTDPVILQWQARLISKRAETIDQLLGASRVYQRLLQAGAADPEMMDDSYRELAAVYIKYSDALHATAVYRGLTDMVAYESRYRAAEEIARRLVDEHPDDAECHRLWAMSLEGLAVPGASEVLERSVAEYVRTLELDPKDLLASERLARLYRERLRDLAKAEEVLDRMIEAKPDPIESRLVRYRYLRELARTDRAAEERAGQELDKALEEDPSNLMVRLAAAEHALRNGRALEARDHVRVLQGSDDFRVSIMSGLVEFAQEHPQEALEQWRQGLIQMQGTHAELAWWLAYVQLRLGRVEQASPLITRYRQLVGNDEDHGLRFLEALSDERAGRPKRALQVLEQIRSKAPGRLREEISVALGRCYEALGETELAMRAYRQAEQLAPGSALPRLAITELLLEQGPDESIRELSAAVSEGEPAPDPDLILALAKAHVLRQASRPERSRTWREVDRLVERLESLGISRSALALLRADRATLDGRPDDAVELLRGAAAADPINATVWAGLATALAASSTAGRAEEAFAVLDQASRPEAAGDTATLRLTRARILVSLDRGRDAQEALVGNLDRVAVDQQGMLWEALGRLRATQGDLEGARQAYERWAMVCPGIPQPALALLQMALYQGDETSAKRHLERLYELGGGKALAGENDLNYRLGRALTLYQFAEPEMASSDRARQASGLASLQQAEGLADGIVKDAPKLAPAYLLKGQILELRGDLASAALAYRKAWDNGGEASLPKLLDVMARLGRFEEIEELAGPEAALQVGALSVGALLNVGESERAAKLLNQMVADPAQTDAWRAKLLELAGRTEAVEALLRARAERAAADDYSPWLLLIGTQARHGRPPSTVDATIGEFVGRARSDRPDLLRANALWAAMRYVEAERLFERVAVDQTSDAQALADVSLYYERTGRADRAAALLEKALLSDRSNRSVARQLAVILTSQATDEKAAARAWELVGGEVEPKSPEDRLARCVVLSRSPVASRREQAIPALEALVGDLDPKLTSASAARDFLTQLLLIAGRPKRAAELASISAGRGDDSGAMALHARARIAAGQFTEAADQLDQLMVLNPLDPNEPALRAKLVAEQAGGAAAPAALVDAVERRGTSPTATALGRAAYVLLTQPSGPEAVVSDQAWEAAGRIASKLSGREPALGWMMGQILRRQGRIDDGLAACRGVIDAPNAAESDRYEACRTAMAIAGEATDRLGSAAEVLDAALRLRSDDPTLMTMRAMAHHGLGEYDQELALYRRILEIWPPARPETDQVQNNLAWVLSECAAKPEGAIDLAEDLVARHGDDPRYLCTRGVILIRLNQSERAIVDLEKSVAADPTNGRRILHLARAYRAAGRAEEFQTATERLRLSGLRSSDCDPTERIELQSILGENVLDRRPESAPSVTVGSASN